MNVNRHHRDQGIMDFVGAWTMVAREAKGWTQGELAAEAKLTRQTINEIERGKANITISTVALLARALGETPSALLPRYHTDWRVAGT